MATKIEEIKSNASFEEIWKKIKHYGREGLGEIPDEDLHLLRFYGVFYRKPTPGYFMIRVRVPGGILESGKFTTSQLEALANITEKYGRDIIDITTRQQVQLRWIKIEDVPPIIEQLNRVGLTTLQTGHDNIRGVTTCPVAGLSADEVMDTRELVKEVNDAFVGNWKYTNLPRKLNITIIGCHDDCTHAEINDIAFTPAERKGEIGFHVWVGGGLGPWGTQRSLFLDAFVRKEEVKEVCLRILDLYTEYGNREKRNRARLKFIIDEWGLDKFREKLQSVLSFKLKRGGLARTHPHRHNDHIGIHPQHNPKYVYAGLNVLTGRLYLSQVRELIRIAKEYGTGEIRLTTDQNVIIPNIPKERLLEFKSEPLLSELSINPSPFTRGLIACTGKTFCPNALIETKDRSKELAAYLDEHVGAEVMKATGGLTIHASGCPNSCGNPHTGQIGIIGKKIKVDGKFVEAADIYLGAEFGLYGGFNELWKSRVPFEEAGPLLAEVIKRFVSQKYKYETFREWCIRVGEIKGSLNEFAPMIHER
ncbi:nitrite/sulfite reductase [Calidifontibacillus erzurumensis]|uniref:Ferredoxin--nitrite reductase n=1 Tax=Calidifontibacillus erzurumensis TaxID=2741433 RepID=A0A8J8KBA8_9BACI|nr:ferredoxin--nitrite reductase [Calidifontibacillus erzurumensis]NSL51729.1 ferredoxin--nitrite reductase [Calidifontibacillus erzurumensis]